MVTHTRHLGWLGSVWRHRLCLQTSQANETIDVLYIKRSVCYHFSRICPHNFSFHTLSLYFLCDMSHNSSHLRTSSINFSSISEDNQAGLIASKHSKRSGDDVITAHMIRIEHVGLRDVTSNILAWGRRRNGTETWRTRSCQCEHLRLITHEKSLLNGDVPRRTGNVTYSVNRP